MIPLGSWVSWHWLFTRSLSNTGNDPTWLTVATLVCEVFPNSSWAHFLDTYFNCLCYLVLRLLNDSWAIDDVPQDHNDVLHLSYYMSKKPLCGKSHQGVLGGSPEVRTASSVTSIYVYVTSVAGSHTGREAFIRIATTNHEWCWLQQGVWPSEIIYRHVTGLRLRPDWPSVNRRIDYRCSSSRWCHV